MGANDIILSSLPNYLPVIFIGGFIGLVIAIIIAAVISAKKRRRAWEEMAAGMGFTFAKDDVQGVAKLYAERFELFRQGHSKRATNVCTGAVGDAEVHVFDYRYVTGGGKNSSTHTFTVLCAVNAGLALPAMKIRREGFFDKLADKLGFHDIDLEDQPEFSDTYLVKGPDKEACRQALPQPIIDQLMEMSLEKKPPLIETNGDGVMLYVNRHLKPAEIGKLIMPGMDLVKLWLGSGS